MGAFTADSGISSKSLTRRFGGLVGTLNRYREWLESNEADSPLLEQLKSRHEVTVPTISAPPARRPARAVWAKREGIEFGAPISFLPLPEEPHPDVLAHGPQPLVAHLLAVGGPHCPKFRRFEFGAHDCRRSGQVATATAIDGPPLPGPGCPPRPADPR